MTRQEYIDAVKVKIEEISPFDEPDAFIANDPTSPVKPIISYIDKSLDEAAKNCLSSLPLRLLHADVETDHPSIDVRADGVGSFGLANLANKRIIRFRHAELERDITAFITTEDPIYLLQQNKHTRGGQCKPVGVLSSDGGNKMEVYSFEATGTARTISGQTGTAPSTVNHTWLLYINMDKKPGVVSDYPTSTPGTYQYTAAQLVQSPIDELIVLECARIVENILGDVNAAQICQNDFNAKVQAILNN